MNKLKIEYIPIDKLKPWNKNPRTNDVAADKLTKLIESHGFINPIIATKDNIIRAGHTRLKSAQKNGLKEVPLFMLIWIISKQKHLHWLIIKVVNGKL